MERAHDSSARDVARARLRTFTDKLVGRDDALGTLVRTVCAQRLVTLIAPPGVGKTRLAEAAADRVAEAGAFPAGVFCVSLRGVRDADAAIEAVARAVPGGAEACLFVLDGADGLAAARVVTSLLQRFPGLYLLVTARHALGVAAEQVQPLTPLPMGDARRLLLGSGTVSSDDTTLSVLLRLLDGNPQAIRMAAWLLEQESAGALIERLEAPLLQATLHDATAGMLSVLLRLVVEVLPEPAQEALSCLAQMPTGATADDLQALLGPGWEPALATLQRAALASRAEEHYALAVDVTVPAGRRANGPAGVLLAQALYHFQARSHDAAFDLAHRALETCRTTQNRHGFATALLLLGRITLTDDAPRATLLFEEAASHFETQGDRDGVAQARLWQGRALTLLAEPEAALAAFYEAYQQLSRPALAQIFDDAQSVLTGYGGGSLLAALEVDSGAVRESGVLAARVRLGLPGK